MNLSRQTIFACTIVISAGCKTALADNGLVTLPSNNSALVTVEKFEAAVRDIGMKVFTRIDHAAAAREAGLSMPASTVIVFGAPRAGTPNFLRAPTLALDLPLKALVWEDSGGKVFLTYNSGAYVLGAIYPRHGLPAAADGGAEQEKRISGIAAAATK